MKQRSNVAIGAAHRASLGNFSRQRHVALALAACALTWPCLTIGAPKAANKRPKAATASTPEPPAGAAAERDDGFRAFQLRFVAAARGNRVNDVVAMTTFPLHSYEMAGTIAKATRRKGPLDPSIDEATLRKHFRRLFSAEVRKNLQTHKPVYDSGDDDPAMNRYFIGHSSGKTWSAWFVFTRAGDDGSGDWKLVATDNVSE